MRIRKSRLCCFLVNQLRPCSFLKIIAATLSVRCQNALALWRPSLLHCSLSKHKKLRGATWYSASIPYARPQQVSQINHSGCSLSQSSVVQYSNLQPEDTIEDEIQVLSTRDHIGSS